MGWTRIESIIWSLFTVNIIDYRFHFYSQSCRHSCRSLDITILSTIVLLSVFFTVLVFLVCQSEFCPGS